MARVTVEDCLDNVENRFELVLVATKRSRELANSVKDPFVAWENDKPTVVALREIAAGHITGAYLRAKPTTEENMAESLAMDTSSPTIG